ncbi:MFS transporter [Allorhodopirellula solitaria]|uniref:Inner membrane protein YqcE n=1 Tax=Allorhodopirellula solitaria TaxID=2527987 RepID=A0A5C5X7Y2_9BACT|nr:MFS transporter [Allorhodopirellula solitaria]TWT59176.1 Inner membrane protein YqcE [Allorhodopirellula solitaria]
MHSPDSESPPRARRHWYAIATLIVAGEAIFFLPFVIARVFRPTLLEVFGLSNWQLGMAFSAYGITAMLSYFPGGPLADRFAARTLMSIALASTAAGGLVMAAIPDLNTFILLYAFWGLTTVLVFWAALIRATRSWGGQDMQGRAFGFLDGGRGLVAAIIGSLAVAIFAALLPADLETSTLAQRGEAFRHVILLFTAVTFLTALLVWCVLPDEETTTVVTNDQSAWEGIRYVARLPTVWLQAAIIVCAYVGYKGLDDVSLYAKEALGFDEVSAAYASTISMWVRPPAAIITGWIADRYRVTSVTCWAFIAMLLGSLVAASGVIQMGMTALFFATILTTSAAIFALRGLYFSIMREGNIPFVYTGSAVGLVSAIGYTPEVFMGPLMGFLLDRSPGAIGHQQVFAVIAVFSLIGLAATLWYQRLSAPTLTPKTEGS